MRWLWGVGTIAIRIFLMFFLFLFTKDISISKRVLIFDDWGPKRTLFLFPCIQYITGMNVLALCIEARQREGNSSSKKSPLCGSPDSLSFRNMKEYPIHLF